MPLSTIKKMFEQIHLYTISMQGISTIFIDQMPTISLSLSLSLSLSSPFRKSTFYVASKFSNSLLGSLTVRKNEKENLK
jgi:hypothetical protein